MTCTRIRFNSKKYQDCLYVVLFNSWVVLEMVAFMTNHKQKHYHSNAEILQEPGGLTNLFTLQQFVILLKQLQYMEHLC